MSANAEAFPGDHVLSPLRAPNPDRLDAERRSLPVPTGYFKVIYRPATVESPAQAIGFLLPHSYERLDRLADRYEGLDSDEAYWGFVSRIEVIEELSGIRFPGISEELKREWRSPGSSSAEVFARFAPRIVEMAAPPAS
ncbi:MAG: hypothetical protein U5L08_01455 [Xanthomonadales bacterium]|nr:hypothetical protein [Xanthomonadales bacterium]